MTAWSRIPCYFRSDVLNVIGFKLNSACFPGNPWKKDLMTFMFNRWLMLLKTLSVGPKRVSALLHESEMWKGFWVPKKWIYWCWRLRMQEKGGPVWYQVKCMTRVEHRKEFCIEQEAGADLKLNSFGESFNFLIFPPFKYCRALDAIISTLMIESSNPETFGLQQISPTIVNSVLVFFFFVVFPLLVFRFVRVRPVTVVQWSVAPLTRLNYHSSIPRWENQSLYDSSDSKLVLLCMQGTQITISLLQKQPPDEGATDNLASRWLLLRAITRATDEYLRLSLRVTGRMREFLILNWVLKVKSEMNGIVMTRKKV